MKKKIKALVAPYEVWSTPMRENGVEFRERFARGAFGKALARGAPVALKFEHGLKTCKVPLANTADGNLRAWEDDSGLWVEGELPDTHCGRMISEGIERGDLRDMSVGFRRARETWDALRNRRWITEAEPFDASVTKQGIYPHTKVELRSVDGSRAVLEAYFGECAETRSFRDTLAMVRGSSSHGMRSDGEIWLRRHRQKLLALAERRHYSREKVEELEAYFDVLGVPG